MNKEIVTQFEMPKAEIIVFDAADVITTSNGTGGGFEGE